MSTVSLDELKKLPHLDVASLNGRVVPFHALRDGDRWRLWVPAPKGLVEVDGTPAEACYYAKQIVNPNDFHSEFLEFMQQRAYWKDVSGPVDAISSDIFNASACLAKLDLIYRHGDQSQCHRMVATEIEYLFLTCRSIFDLLQRVILELWKKVTLVDQAIKKQELPDSYRKVVMRDKKIMTAEEIKNHRCIPIELAQVYADSAPFFYWLRDYRDLIAHKGQSVEYVFRLDEGFAVSKEDKPFRDMQIWCEANSRPNSLGSLRSVVAHILRTTLETCDRFAEVFGRIIKFPPPIAPQHHIYMCGPSLSNLSGLPGMIDGSAWYENVTKVEDLRA